MKKLIEGIIDFRKQICDHKRELFENLALGQRPDALFFACSDSRVVPNLFASTDPGDLFVVRNIGNLVPPASTKDASVPAAIEFAVNILDVKDIVICGHSECGAMQLLASEQKGSCCPHTEEWVQYAAESLKAWKEHDVPDPTLSGHNQLSQVNVLMQMEHLKTYPCVAERVEQDALAIHGWWFDVAKAAVYVYDKAQKRFMMIDESWPIPSE